MSRPLIVALHGVGSSARDMAAALAPLATVADVVVLDGTEPFDHGGSGRQWFSVIGVTEDDRPLRVAGALPALLSRLDQVAAEHDVARDELVLLAFSQGAIMTLAMIAQQLHRGRAIAIAGRLAAPVKSPADQPATLLLIHDRADHVMPPHLADEAKAKLVAAGHRVDLAHTNGIGHGIGPATITAIADWLAATASCQATNSTLTEG